MEIWHTYEADIRLAAFIGLFVVLAVWELLAPRRALRVSKGLRWANNIGLVVLNTTLLRVLFPAATVGMAAFAIERGWGLLHTADLPGWLAFAIALVVLDFAIWLQHVMMHAVPLLWRLHRVHHADLDCDLTTGSRFHPIEIVLSMLLKCSAIAALGPPVAAVVAFEVMLNGMALFNHANIRLPTAFDRALRVLLVTPDMHRVHHSIADDEANANFGFNLALWDRLFGTYRAQPRAGHEGMTIGIRDYRDERSVSRLTGMLALPFRGGVTDHAIKDLPTHDADGPMSDSAPPVRPTSPLGRYGTDMQTGSRR